MSPPEVWGPAIWNLFHMLAEKVNEELFTFIKFDLFGQIKRICLYLPCPECSIHATNFLAKININNINNKIEFRNLFYLFHNYVNAKKRKPLYNYSNITKYNNYSFIHVVNNFISKYNTKGNMKLLSESFQRNLVINDFKSWINKNIRGFITPKNIPQTIPETIINEEVNVVVSEELQVASEELQVASEELQVASEELQVDSEELQVASEELQVDSEELQVASEELQVASEELQVAIEELQVASEELQVASEELQVDSEELHVASEELQVDSEELQVDSEELQVIIEEVSSDEFVVQSKSKKAKKYKKY